MGTALILLLVALAAFALGFVIATSRLNNQISEISKLFQKVQGDANRYSETIVGLQKELGGANQKIFDAENETRRARSDREDLRRQYVELERAARGVIEQLSPIPPKDDAKTWEEIASEARTTLILELDGPTAAPEISRGPELDDFADDMPTGYRSLGYLQAPTAGEILDPAHPGFGKVTVYDELQGWLYYDPDELTDEQKADLLRRGAVFPNKAAKPRTEVQVAPDDPRLNDPGMGKGIGAALEAGDDRPASQD